MADSIGLTLTEAAKLSTDMLQKGVIMTMVDASPVLDRVPFMSVEGNGYSYNTLDKMPTVGFRKVGSGFTEAGFTVSRQTETLVILGGTIDIDSYVAQTRGNVQDLRAMQTAIKAKAVAMEFESTFFKGDTSTNADSFDGLEKRLTGKKVGNEVKGEIKAGTPEEVAASMDLLNQLIDAVPGCQVLYMDKAMRRKVTLLLNKAGYQTGTGVNEFGKHAIMYCGVEIVAVEDGICSADTIYAVAFGAEEKVAGLTNGGIQVTDLGLLNEKPVYRTLIQWFCGMAVFNKNAFAILKKK